MPFPTRAAEQLPPIPSDVKVEWRDGWRRADAGLEADAQAFWARNNLLPAAKAMERTGEINLCAYVDGQMAGLSTARLRDIGFLRARMAMHRVAVEPGHQRVGLSSWLTVKSIEALEAWSLAHPEEKVMGVGAVIQAPLDTRERPLWRTGLDLAGYTAENEQFRVAWFTHAAVN